MPDPSTTQRAVFLSYAREDADAAGRIATALRAFGVEVWFDLNELRGGDAWDAKIRKQIRECALFIALVSANSQQREEGYFRREWLLAVERKRDMAESRVFILPVIVDDTREADANVPEQFLKVQFSRLPGGEPTAQFVEQVKRLLQPARPAAGTPAPAVAPAHAPARAAGHQSTPKWPIYVAAGIVAAAGLWFWQFRTPAAPPPVAPPIQTAAVVPKVDDKSVAVLPFANMSEDKDTGFFADGIHEDLLTNLAMIAELKVISRTSVMQYRGTTKTIRQIGQELGVAYVLEGSVRRAGNQVRVTGQLINTRTDEHVWAKSYDRGLSDVFSIQAALSQEIASALSAAISPETKKNLERRPTDNPAAYDLYLRARADFDRAPRGNPVALQKAEEMFQAVVDLDPKFAEAWGELAIIHALDVFWGRDGSPARLAKGAAAIARAQALAPDSPEIIGDVGTFAYYAHRDYAKAVAQYERLAQLQPNNAQMHFSLGLVLRRQGHWADSLVRMRRTLELEPNAVGHLMTYREMLFHLRRWDEMRAIKRRLDALMPNNLRDDLFFAGSVEASLTGTDSAFQALWEKLTPEQRASPLALYYRKGWAQFTRNTAEFKRLDALIPTLEDEEDPADGAVNSAVYLWSIGEKPAAAARVAPFFEVVRQQAAQQPDNPLALQRLGFCQLLSGQVEAGLATLRATKQMITTSLDAMDGPNYEESYLAGCALAGRNEEVLAGLPALLRIPTLSTPMGIRFDPAFASLRGDPRFEAILNDPANNRAPLY